MKRILCACLTAALLVGCGTVLAEEDKNGRQTTVGILESRVNPKQVSFSVPLNVPLAAVSGETELEAPSNYSIENTSEGLDIKVTGVTVSIQGDWKLVDETPKTGNELQMSIGGLQLPALADGVQTITEFGGSALADKIASGTQRNLALSGTVAEKTREESTSDSAQFYVSYTVSAVDKNGNLIGGLTYVGNEKPGNWGGTDE